MSIKMFKCTNCGKEISTPSKFNNKNVCAGCFSQLAKEEKRKLKEERKHQVTETKVTCKACGKVWYYGKQETGQNRSSAMQNCGKIGMCCSCSPLALLIPDKEIKELDKCPKCGSRAIKKETITHNV